MATITVLGAGMMGSALCVPLVDHGHDVRLVGTHLDADIIRQLRESGVHPKLGQPLPRAITPFFIEELDRAMAGATLIGIGVSSAGVRWAGEKLSPYVSSETPIAMISKGLHWDGTRLVTLPDLLESQLPQAVRGRVRPAAIAGPCIAGELSRRVETCVVVTGRERAKLDAIAAEFSAPYYRLFVSDDVTGVEACAALKNAYAMGIGFAAGIHEKRGGTPGSVAMHNYESAVFAQSVHEMRAIVTRIGGDPGSVHGLAGVGDLDVTTNGGRTGRFGRLLGLGLSLTEAIAEMKGATLECLDILRVLREASPALGLGALPLLRHMTEVALDGKPVQMPFSEFFQ